MSELPIGWAETTLKIVCAKITDGTHHSPVNLPTGEFMYVTAKNIRKWGLDLSNISFVNAETHDEIYSRCPVEKGDVLYIKDGATTGLAIINPLDEPFSLLSSVALLKPSRDALNADFLKYWLNSPDTLRKMLGQMTGTAIRRLTLTKISSQLIALPPPPEQKRIVRKLDTLSASTTTARTHLTAISKLVERYKKGVYFHHFEKTEDRVPLSSLAKVGTGATPKKGNPRYYEQGSVPWVTSGAVNSKTVLEPSDYITETALKETNCKLFPAGSLIMAMYGEGKTRGQVARLGIEAATNQALAVIHDIDADKVNVDYLYRFLDSIYLEIREMAEGGVQPNLSLGKVKAFELPLPTLDEQREIVRQIETAFAKIDRLASEATKALKLADRLDQRILAKAFAGELVPQDPNDEPASVLLDRIREARANAPKKTRPRRTKATAMKKDPKDLLLADSAKWPANGVTSEELANRVAMPHSDLRDALFELLGGAKPQLEQVFDKTEERMRLKRVAQ